MSVRFLPFPCNEHITMLNPNVRTNKKAMAMVSSSQKTLVKYKSYHFHNVYIQ